VKTIESSLFRLISLTVRMQSINKSLEAKHGLSIVQWSFMQKLADMPSITPRVMATTLGLTPGTLTQTISRLQKKKYISVIADPKDARKKLITLTRLGANVLNSKNVAYKNIFLMINNCASELKVIDTFLLDVQTGIPNK
jgi:DNA-binding MarR family transcriptional regulator